MALRARFALLVTLLAVAIQPANGQSFLESLFGSDEPARSRPPRGYARSQPPPSWFDGLLAPFGQNPRQPQARLTIYRTLCVRMCDGFYFPISYATSSANFVNDAEKCAASCGGEARLFYYPNPGGEVEGMLDMTGRAYASYPAAFKYRHTLVEGCQCRPQPWTEAERARHRAYAAARTPAIRPAGANASAAPALISGTPGDTKTTPAPINRSDFVDPGPRPSQEAPPSTVLPVPAQQGPTPGYRQDQDAKWDGPSGRSVQPRSRYGGPDAR